MWGYRNPVEVRFGQSAFQELPAIIAGRAYALVTYPPRISEPWTERLTGHSGQPVLAITDIAPNPDIRALQTQVARFSDSAAAPEVIVAIGGGSVIDSAKVFAAASGEFGRVERLLKGPDGAAIPAPLPIIAVPTTAGTGSEVTCWGTVWDHENGRKLSIEHPGLYPTHAVVDPALTAGMSRALTVSTGLDALSHAFESIWNRNANPVSTNHAIAAAREILAVLPLLVDDLNDRELRTRMARAALLAGLAFSNTKTAIAHSISYPMTLRHNLQHGIACSFTLPAILRSLAPDDLECRPALTAILGTDLMRGADRVESFLEGLGVATSPASYGVDKAEWRELLRHSLTGERGRNFVGSHAALLSLDRFSMNA